VLCIPLLAKMNEEAQEKDTEGEEIMKRNKKRGKIVII
jgi:hypothetical protein